MLQSNSHLNNSQIRLATRRSSQGSSPKAGATSPQARAAAYGDRLSQLKKDMAEIRDGTMKEVLEKLRLLSYEIEEINRRFGTVDRTGDTLDDFRVRLDCYENEMADFRSGGRSGGRGGHSGGGRGKRDGKGRPPNQRQPQHQPRHQREQQPAHQPQ